MTQQQIEQAAIERCTTATMEEWKKDFGIACFNDGANWRIDSVWHNKDEKPEIGELILLKHRIDRKGRMYHTAVLEEDDDWYATSAKGGFIGWAYVADLTPDGKEEE